MFANARKLRERLFGEDGVNCLNIYRGEEESRCVENNESNISNLQERINELELIIGSLIPKKKVVKKKAAKKKK